MDSITPIRQIISERFPIASFLVRVPEERYLEVACATDPRLFHPAYAGWRCSRNFYTSREKGLLPARRGDTTWILPPEQLKSFAGAQRLYYALGTYGGRGNESPRFTVSPDHLNHVPSIQLSPDLSGRSLDRRNFRTAAEARAVYGGQDRRALRWGGDIVLEAEARRHAAAERAAGRLGYDDGFDPALWRGGPAAAGPALNSGDFDPDYANDGASENTATAATVTGTIDCEYEDGFDYYRSQQGVPAMPASVAAFGVNDDVLIAELVANGASEAEVRAFIDALQESPPPAVAAAVRPMTGDGVRIHLPGGHTLDGWRAQALLALVGAALRSNPATAAMAIDPNIILAACDRLNITVGIGPAVTGGLGAGGGGSMGVLFAPRQMIGFFGSYYGLVGWIHSISAAIQVTVVDGGPENFAGEAFGSSISVDLSEGLGIGATVLTTPDRSRVIGVTAELHLSLGIPIISVLEVFAQQQQTATTMAWNHATAAAVSSGIDRPASSFVQAAYGGRRVAATAGSRIRGKAASYREETLEEPLPVGPAAAPLGLQPLDIAEKVRILRIVGRAESGNDGYAAVSVDPQAPTNGIAGPQNHFGLAWGFLLFTQRSGAIGRVLKKTREREIALAATNGSTGLPAEQTLAALFGPHLLDLLAVTDPEVTTSPDARLASVGGSPLWREPWLSRFRAAGTMPHVQAAQNEIAVVDIFDRVLPVAQWLDLQTARGLAILLDRVAHAGFGGGLSWVMGVIGPIRAESDRRLALQAVGQSDDLAEFQRQRGIEAVGEWNALTHAALTDALRGLGDASPIAVMAPDEMLRALVAAAQGTEFEARLRALYDNGSDFDDTVSYTS